MANLYRFAICYLVLPNMCSLEDSFDTLSYQERDHHGITSGEQRYHDGGKCCPCDFFL